MTSKEIVELLKKQDKTVYVKIDGGLYYPIAAIKQEGKNLIIFCPDPSKGNKYW